MASTCTPLFTIPPTPLVSAYGEAKPAYRGIVSGVKLAAGWVDPGKEV